MSMLTINADGHPLMQRFHKPHDEKRMVVVFRRDQYDDWPHCPVEDARAFFERYPAKRFTAAQKPTKEAMQETLGED
jgi:putative SOS response-associated peptidase YedK